jgi:hypothetical protein
MSFFRTWQSNRRTKKMERREKQQREEAAFAAQTIRDFLEGAGETWDWDDFTSCSLRDPQLNSIRKRAGAVDLPVGPEERATLEALAEEAERFAKG